MKKYTRAIFYGFLAWLVPFLVSIPFHSASGELIIDVFLFQAIMLVFGAASASCFLVLYFKEIDAGFFREGIVVGLIWLGVSILSDALTTIIMTEMPLRDYVVHIGSRYLATTAASVAIGAALANKK